MILKSLDFKGFRNLKEDKINFNKGVNLIYGNNGQGKTNTLEAIYVLATGKDFRTTSLSEAVKEGEEFFSLSGMTEYDHLKITYSEEEGKNIYANNEKIPLTDYLDILSVVVFSATDMDVLRGYPSERRKMIDGGIAREDIGYIKSLRAYRKIKKQKNALLKKSKPGIQLELWNRKQAKHGSDITLKRMKYLNRLKKKAAEHFESFFPEAGSLDIKYESSWAEEEMDSSVLFKVLEDKKQQEKERGYTLAGPHRDNISVRIGGKNISEYGSSGQLKSALLSLKFSIAELTEDQKGDYPLICLDDVGAELDGERTIKIMNYLSDKKQSFVTSINKDVGKRVNSFEIRRGEIFNN